MSSKLYGVLSLMLGVVAFLIAVFAVAKVSLFMGILYLLILLILFTVIIYSYCTKCTCRFSCSHVIVGKITELFPEREQGSYTGNEIFAVIASLIIMVSFPQVYLLRDYRLLFIFWGLLVVTILLIYFRVCKSCKNENCFVCKVSTI